MQPIERYALVTLLFLIVLIVVGALWDDGKVDASGGPAQEIARSQATESRPSPRTRSSRRGEGLPLNVREPAPEVTRQRTAVPPSRAARRTPAAAEGSASDRSGPQSTPAYGGFSRSGAPRTGAPSVADLEGSLRPEPREDWSGGYLNRRELTSTTGGAVAGPSDTLRPAASGAPRTAAEVVARPRAATAKADAPRTRAYTIQGGDSLERIARRELNDPRAVDRIASLNGLSKPYTIYSGRTLLLPVDHAGAATTLSAPTSTAPAAPAQASAAVAGRPTYTVQSGDSLSAVLVREFGTYKRSLPLVKTLNPGLDVNQIRPGMRIVLPRTDEIPGGVSVAAAPPAVETAAPTPRREFIVR
jgi:nucleoid-associated protein YgaU